LGYGDSYFVRFLDGSVDYNLPAHMAEAMEDAATRSPTSICLHPELPDDYIVRHRGLSA
jgi:hypothetical protein